MNLDWTSLTLTQRNALAILCRKGPSPLPSELGEQLMNLGLAERAANHLYAISPLGTTVPPAQLH